MRRAQHRQLERQRRRAHTTDHESKAQPSRPFRLRRCRRDLTGATAGGDRIAHLVGPPQRHGDSRREHVDDLQRPPPPARPPGGGTCLGRSRRAAYSTRNSSISIGNARNANASATAQSSTGIRSSRSGRPNVATAGAISATFVVHDTIAPSPSSTIDNAVMRRKLNSPPSAEFHRAQIDHRTAAREGGGSAAEEQQDPQPARNRRQRAARNVRQPRRRQYQSSDQADRHPARVERQQHPDAGHHNELRAGPQPVDDGVARHRPQQHHRLALPGVRRGRS